MRNILLLPFLLLLAANASAQNLKISYNAQWGISKLTFKGIELVNLAKKIGGPIGLESYKYINNKRESIDTWSHISTHGYNEKTNEYIAKCKWGTMVCKYMPKSDTLFISYTFTNESKTDTFCGVSLCPLTLQVGKRPVNFQPLYPYYSNGTASAPVIYADLGDYKISIESLDDATKAYVGFIEENHSNGTRYRLWNSNYPFIGMTNFDWSSGIKLAPGKSYTLNVAIKFLNNNASVATTSKATYDSYRKANPFNVNWKDRRPIGMLMLSSYEDKKNIKNPRHWKLSGSLSGNLLSKQGKQQLRKEVLAYANQSIAILKDMDAQAMITWDIEGQEFPHPWSYIGSPDLLSKLAPEMNEIADEYFKQFKRNGIETGICIRPDSVVINKNASWIEHIAVKDPAALLIRKIKYAQKRWGCKIFYIDTNVDEAGKLMDANIFDRVSAACPGVLLIPEHENTGYFASTVPYGEFRANEFNVSESIKAVYPHAFMALVVPEGLPKNQSANDHIKLLKNSAESGNIFLFRAWYKDPVNDLIKKAKRK